MCVCVWGGGGGESIGDRGGGVGVGGRESIGDRGS